jgi:uncharacterized membrane protein YheB (UPF0754 family)
LKALQLAKPVVQCYFEIIGSKISHYYYNLLNGHEPATCKKCKGREKENMIKIGRKIAIISLPVLTLISGIILRFNVEHQWIDWIFKITLSGTVGIWTNYFAIKMLFRPHYRTAFGRQGLIPAKRDDIAEAIAVAVSEELLDTDAILEYVEENDLVKQTASGLLEYAHSWIDDPRNRRFIINTAGTYVQNRGVEQVGELLSHAAELIRDYASEKLSSDNVWPYIRNTIEHELEKAENIQLISMVIINLVEKNALVIAELVNEMLEDWINSQNFMVKNMVKLGKELFGINSRKIGKELQEKVGEPSFLQDVVNLIEENNILISSMGDDPVLKEHFFLFFEEQKQRLDNWVKTKGVDAARGKLLAYIESESFWNWIENQLDSAIGKLREIAEKRIHSEEFRKTASNLMLRFAGNIEIKDIVRKKVNEFELQQLEKLITKVSGDNLCGIELFGGILGMLAGLILIDQWFVLGIPAVIAVLWLIERSLTGNRPESL